MSRCIILDLAVLLATLAAIHGRVLRNTDECPLPRISIPACPLRDSEFSVFFPHPSDCHWFFHCSNGVALCKKCPANLHWNTKLETCDYAFRAGCNANSSVFIQSTNVTTPQPVSPTTTISVAVTTEASTIADPPNPADSTTRCPDGPVPKCDYPDQKYSVLFPHPSDCHWFFQCSNGVALCKKCPANLHWNTNLETCDYAFRAGCNAYSSVFVPTTNENTPQPSFTTTTTESTVMSTELPAVTAEQVSKCPDGPIPECNYPDQGYSVFFPHPNDFHWFFHCSNGVAHCKKCPAKMQWDVKLETCVLHTELNAVRYVLLPYQQIRQHNRVYLGQPLV
jgi:hypothetical protein